MSTVDAYRARLVQIASQLKEKTAIGITDVFMGATCDKAGRVINIRQALPDKKGPKKGHWMIDSRTGQKKGWAKGQHNYNRQLDRKKLEPALGTIVMNTNVKLNRIDEDDLNPEARVLSFAKVRRFYEGESWDVIAAEALEKAVAELAKATASAATNQPTDLGESEKQRGFVVHGVPLK